MTDSAQDNATNCAFQLVVCIHILRSKPSNQSISEHLSTLQAAYPLPPDAAPAAATSQAPDPTPAESLALADMQKKCTGDAVAAKATSKPKKRPAAAEHANSTNGPAATKRKPRQSNVLREAISPSTTHDDPSIGPLPPCPMSDKEQAAAKKTAKSRKRPAAFPEQIAHSDATVAEQEPPPSKRSKKLITNNHNPSATGKALGSGDAPGPPGSGTQSLQLPSIQPANETIHSLAAQTETGAGGATKPNKRTAEPSHKHTQPKKKRKQSTTKANDTRLPTCATVATEDTDASFSDCVDMIKKENSLFPSAQNALDTLQPLFMTGHPSTVSEMEVLVDVLEALRGLSAVLGDYLLRMKDGTVPPFASIDALQVLIFNLVSVLPAQPDRVATLTDMFFKWFLRPLMPFFFSYSTTLRKQTDPNRDDARPTIGGLFMIFFQWSRQNDPSLAQQVASLSIEELTRLIRLRPTSNINRALARRDAILYICSILHYSFQGLEDSGAKEALGRSLGSLVLDTAKLPDSAGQPSSMALSDEEWSAILGVVEAL